MSWCCKPNNTLKENCAVIVAPTSTAKNTFGDD